jgi:hypothetical protein
VAEIDHALSLPYSRPRSSAKDSGQSSLEAAEFLARLLDAAFFVPGTRIGIGLDAVIGLIPGGGDLITSLASLYILSVANRHRVPRITQLRMALNIVIDALVGSIPVVGDLFDVYWKANLKNVELLRRYLATEGASAAKLKRRDGWFVAAILAGTALLVLGMAAVAFYLLSWTGVFLRHWFA